MKTKVTMAAWLFLSQLGLAQQPAAPTITLGQAKIDSTLLEARMYKVIGDRSEALKDLPGTFPVVIFNQKTVDANGTETYTPIGFPVNCRGRDPRAAVNAFGEVFLDMDNPEVVTEEDLELLFRVSEQPILRCDALNGQNQGTPLFSQLFRVVDRAAKKSYQLVRFNAFSPMDKRLFELGCSNILQTFWTETDTRKSTLVFKESLGDVPGANDIGALHCFNTATASATDLTVPVHPEPEPIFDARLYRVEDPERGLVRVLITGGKSFRLNCSASDGELQTAFGFPASGRLPTLTPDDAGFQDYLAGQMDQQPTLNCPSLSRPNFASDAYHIANLVGLDLRTAARNPLLRLSAAEDALVQFSCESAANFFAKKLLEELGTDPGRMQPITWESVDYLVRKYVPGQTKARRYVLGCAAGLLPAAEVKQLIRDVQGREPLSGELALHMNQCSRQGELCTREWMEQMIVERAGENMSAASRLVVGAFSAALGRTPQPEELNYFLKSFQAGRQPRAHAKELRSWLTTRKFLDRKLFISSMVHAAGTEHLSDAMDLWTAKQIDNPGKVYTADIFKAELEAYVKAQFLEDVIKRAFEFNYWSGVQPFQINAMKQKVTAGQVRALYQDMTDLLKKTGPDCVTVAANKEAQTSTFFKPHWKVDTISGTWTADKSAYALVGPVGHTGNAAKRPRLDEKYSLGQLLISTKDAKGVWQPWTGWTGSLFYDHYINEVKMLMNDLPGAYGDNSGSIKVCFE